jgi:NAD(P)-dependent dehydrogenase (short-subunit alcohol dehydrogenase family)
METRLDKRAVLVTGTSTGIGRATALQLDKMGYGVFATVRRQKDADELQSAASGRLVPIQLDVTNGADIARARDEIARRVGEHGLWGLVNNAGISFRALLEYVPLDEFRRLYDSNVFGLLAVTQAFLPLIRQARGRIVNVSSIAALLVTPFHGIYSSAKLAVNGLTEALRLEVKPFGVQVALVIYGGVQTPIWEHVRKSTDELTRHFPAEFIQLYAARQEKALGYFFAKGKSGLLPEQAALPIIHALTTRIPKRTYITGSDARFFNLLDKVIYGRLRDWIMLRTMGLLG